MHVPPNLPPVLPNSGNLPQDTVARVVPQIQAQASAPVIQRAVDPSPKSERNNRTRSNNDRGKGGGGANSGGRGSSVNIKV